MRRPAILIPLPTAADDHQTENALEFERAGAAVCCPQHEASATRLGDLADEMLGDPLKPTPMAQAMGDAGPPRRHAGHRRRAEPPSPAASGPPQLPAKQRAMFRKRNVAIHFVGIGGIGMSGIAEVLLTWATRSPAPTCTTSDITRRLASLGAGDRHRPPRR